jgi:predicted DNA-binding transcriptional regulator YafY
MPRKRVLPRRSSGGITADRSARLFRIIAVLRAGPKSRDELLPLLAVDLRSFYRDLEKLRELGIRFTLRNHQYRLTTSFDAAISRLPFPDPQMNLREAIQLATGRTAAHRKLKRAISAITGK